MYHWLTFSIEIATSNGVAVPKLKAIYAIVNWCIATGMAATWMRDHDSNIRIKSLYLKV